ncbi:hypothetical protein N1851_014267 [Merluccius polli]|uniref:Uncharacterized protein n=1 Tax=Merluccius polli TaxID=89951 RepID=A0AA47MUK4_MERPO|nr:hypothetical protein N1851_014267 [Merluccius polli]
MTFKQTLDLDHLITTMAISADAPLVDSAFGKVQEGSPIPHQYLQWLETTLDTARIIEVATWDQSHCGVAPCQEDQDHIFLPQRFAMSAVRVQHNILQRGRDLKGRGSNGGRGAWHWSLLPFRNIVS